MANFPDNVIKVSFSSLIKAACNPETLGLIPPRLISSPSGKQMSLKTLGVSSDPFTVRVRSLGIDATLHFFVLFGSVESGDVFSKISQNETDQGTAIVEDFLRTWKVESEAQEDPTMAGSEEERLKTLRVVVERYKEQFEKNAWVKAVLENL